MSADKLQPSQTSFYIFIVKGADKLKNSGMGHTGHSGGSSQKVTFNKKDLNPGYEICIKFPIYQINK